MQGVSLKERYSEAIHLKVEMFLKTYGTSKPIRYTFSEVKKMSRQDFCHCACPQVRLHRNCQGGRCFA
jgi:hypothetical protein